MLGRGRADSRQPLSARSPLFCSRPPRHTQRNQPCGLGSRCGPSTWGALGWNTELVGCRVGLSEGRACSRRLWGQRGSPAGVYGLSLRGAHGADLALECPMAQWPDQGQRCLDPRGVGGGFCVLPCCVLCSGPPRPPMPLTAAWSLPGALCPHGSAAYRTQVPHTERPWALVLHTEQLQKPRRAEGSQVLSSGGGSGWGPCSPLQAHSGSLQGAPLLVLCALPWRAWGCPCPLPGLCPRLQPPSPPLGASFVAASTGGCAPDRWAPLTPPRVGNRTFEVVTHMQRQLREIVGFGIIFLT